MKNSDSIENAPAVPVRVAADERALSLLSGISRTIISLRDGWGDKNDADEAIANIAEVKSALAAAPVQAQEPFAYMIADPDGKAWISGDESVSECDSDLTECLTELNLKLSPGHTIVPVYRRAPVHVAVPDGGARIKHERDTLAQGIADAALKAGIWNGEVPLSGPHLLMMLNDMAECIAAPAAQGDAIELLEDVMRPYGIYDVAVSKGGVLQMDFIEIGNRIRAAIASKTGNTKDAARLQFLLEQEAGVTRVLPKLWLVQALNGTELGSSNESAIAAIDAAIAAKAAS